jgi:hypothetical protein
MMDHEVSFQIESTVQHYLGVGGWHYALISKLQSEEIKKYIHQKRSWGAVPITVTLGKIFILSFSRKSFLKHRST